MVPRRKLNKLCLTQAALLESGAAENQIVKLTTRRLKNYLITRNLPAKLLQSNNLIDNRQLDKDVRAQNGLMNFNIHLFVTNQMGLLNCVAAANDCPLTLGGILDALASPAGTFTSADDCPEDKTLRFCSTIIYPETIDFTDNDTINGIIDEFSRAKVGIHKGNFKLIDLDHDYKKSNSH